MIHSVAVSDLNDPVLVIRVHLSSACDIDIPEADQSTLHYSATLAHKANHSFSPNCIWSRIDHPRFGLICSLTASERIEAGEEVVVKYGLPLHLAPDWYRQCHHQWSTISQ